MRYHPCGFRGDYYDLKDVPSTDMSWYEFILRDTDLMWTPLALFAIPHRAANVLRDVYYHTRRIPHLHYDVSDTFDDQNADLPLI